MRNDEWEWRRPELTRANQIAFWDRQAAGYESADMTSNPHEIEGVVEMTNPCRHSEIIALGGAIGCRDPKMILERAFCTRNSGGTCWPSTCRPRRVFFNDIAPALVGRAKTEILHRCWHGCGLGMEFRDGPIHEVCRDLSGAPRTLFLGVYSADGFFVADPANRYPASGFNEYLSNWQTLGERFWFAVVGRKNGTLDSYSHWLSLDTHSSPEEKEAFLERLRAEYATMVMPVGLAEEPFNPVALEVLASHRGKEGLFLSHWYHLEGLMDVLSEVFPPETFQINRKVFPKGALFIIQRRNVESTGIVTILNNVLGNILPGEQIPTLEAVKKII